jgi:hypothetical protein
MSMEGVLNGVRRVVKRWTRTSTSITQNISEGDTIIKVDNTSRFSFGDEIMIWGQTEGEASLKIQSIVDVFTMQLVEPVKFDHNLSENPVVVKVFNNNYVRAFYLGDPAVIPMFPAISINGTEKNSEWITLEQTKEEYNLDINIYVEESTQEEGYLNLTRIADAVERGLKKNLYPLIGDYLSSAITAPVSVNDKIIRVASTANFLKNVDIAIEDKFNQSWVKIKKIIDSQHIELYCGVDKTFSPQYNAVAIMPYKRLFNSWPTNIDYGFVHKGTLLKAAKIKWFGWQVELHAPTVQDDTYIV